MVLTAGNVDTATQQNMVNTAGSLVNNIPTGLSYYSRCWSIIGIITMNGDVAKAAANIGISGPAPPTPSNPTPPTPTSPTTSAPTTFPTVSPTKLLASSSPTKAPPTTFPTVSPTKLPASSSPTKAPDCKPWCYTEPAPWETKCDWIKCSSCDECGPSQTSNSPSLSITNSPSLSITNSPTPPTTNGPTSTPTSSLVPTLDNDDDLDEQIAALVELLSAIMPLLNTVVSLLNNLLAMFGTGGV